VESRVVRDCRRGSAVLGVLVVLLEGRVVHMSASSMVAIMASCRDDDDDDGNTGAPVAPPEAAAALESSSVGSFVGILSGLVAILP